MGNAKKQSRASWRKRGAALEDAAMQVRREADQERRTGGSMSTLSDAQLFSIDSTADDEALAPTKRKPKAGGAPAKVLWIDRVVAPNPHIQRVVKPPVASSKPTLSNGSQLVLKKIGKVRQKATRTLAHRAATAALQAAAPPAPVGADPLDIWAGDDSSKSVVPRVCQRSAKRRAPEPSTVASAVMVPKEGASWRPSHSAHQELLAEATEHELARQRKSKLHQMPELFGKWAWEEEEEEADEQAGGKGGAAHAARAAGGEAGGEEEENEEEEEEEEEEDEEAGGKGSTWHEERRALTTKEKNRRARAKEREAAAAAEKLHRRRQKQADRAGALLAEIKKEEKKLVAKQQEEAAHEAQRVKKLGPVKPVPKRPDVLLTEEQPTALRQLAQEGSLMADRFDSLVARNFVEARSEQLRPQRKKLRKVLREGAKDTKYKSKYGWAGKMPAWL